MNIHKTYIAVGLIVAFTLLFELAAHASDAGQSTKITFNQPIQITGQVPSAGAHLFTIADTVDLTLAQSLTSDANHLYTNIRAIPAAANEISDDTTLVSAEQGPGKPDFQLKRLYPGESASHEFLYSHRLEKTIAQDRQQMIVGKQEPTTDSETGGPN